MNGLDHLLWVLLPLEHEVTDMEVAMVQHVISLAGRIGPVDGHHLRGQLGEQNRQSVSNLLHILAPPLQDSNSQSHNLVDEGDTALHRLRDKPFPVASDGLVVVVVQEVGQRMELGQLLHHFGDRIEVLRTLLHQKLVKADVLQDNDFRL